MREVRLELLRPDQIIAEKERCAIAYLPIGPLEWHGPAAPFGTDPLTAHESAVRCAREVGGVVLPPLFMGVDTPRDEQGLQNLGFENTDQYIVGMDFPDNTVPSYYFREEIFAMAVREYVRLLVKQGYRSRRDQSDGRLPAHCRRIPRRRRRQRPRGLPVRGRAGL